MSVEARSMIDAEIAELLLARAILAGVISRPEWRRSGGPRYTKMKREPMDAATRAKIREAHERWAARTRAAK
jgi:hypothetical protein